MNIGFIGAGNMARAIIGGIIESGLVLPVCVRASAPSTDTRARVSAEFGIECALSNDEVAAWADIVVLAVKPQVIGGVIDDIRDSLKPDALVVSIAAGKTLSWLEERFATPVRLVRAMPNTPALVGAGTTGICGNDAATEEDLERVVDLFDSVGITYRLSEPLVDVLGALAGSGPAFVALFMEALADGAVAEGMPRMLAQEAAAQTVMGTAKLALETGQHPGALKDAVCSPGGTTIEGVAALEAHGFRAAAMQAVRAAAAKTRML